MNLLEFTLSGGTYASGEKGSKIPWNDPDFSHRMLENHLSQNHDMFQAAGLTSRQILDADTWPAGEEFQGKLRVFVAERECS